MLGKYLIFVILAAAAYSEITIKITPSKNGADTKVEYFGESYSDITEQTRAQYGLDDETLKIASESFNGKRCDDIYLKTPTPWGDLWQKFGWDRMQAVIRPIEARVVDVNSKPVAIGNSDYVNDHNSLDATYNTGVTQQVAETVTHSWTQGSELGIGQKITYEIKFGVGSIGGETSLDYKATWGETSEKSKEVTLGTTSSVQVVVPPRNSVRATLIATQGTVDIEVRYYVDILGDILCNYNAIFEGHHFYGLGIREMQEDNSLQTLGRFYTEKISVGFYTSARLEVSNTTRA